MNILITGSAGFIGFHLSMYLKKQNNNVIGYDNFNSYYDKTLKFKRAEILQKKYDIKTFAKDIRDKKTIKSLIKKYKITHVVHLAAQAGVRYSISHPESYLASNLDGFLSVLESCRAFPHIKIVYASSSSVYGNNKKIPFSTKDQTDMPANLYGATKKANELIAYSYHHLYKMSLIGLRYFTVYGPWGRPDMAYFKFTKNILENEPIDIYNHGKMLRDFTYIDDIVEGTAKALELKSDFEILNLGNSKPVKLLELINLLEDLLGKKAIKNMLPLQKGEVLETYADISKSAKLLDFSPRVTLDVGIKNFIDWYKKYTSDYFSSQKEFCLSY